jgi:hypothetical protein
METPTTHKPVKNSSLSRQTSYSYRGLTIEKRSDGSWSYRDWSKTGSTTFGNPRSYRDYYFTRLKDAVSFIDSEKDGK